MQSRFRVLPFQRSLHGELNPRWICGTAKVSAIVPVDNQVQTQLSKIPGIGDIPILGKLFQSTSSNKSRSELLVIVTPRIVQPLAAGQLPPGPVFPTPFLEPNAPEAPKTPATK